MDSEDTGGEAEKTVPESAAVESEIEKILKKTKIITEEKIGEDEYNIKINFTDFDESEGDAGDEMEKHDAETDLNSVSQEMSQTGGVVQEGSTSREQAEGTSVPGLEIETSTVTSHSNLPEETCIFSCCRSDYSGDST